MPNEQVFIACVLSFLAGCLLIHYLGPAGKRARRLHKALSRLSLVHDTYYTESQEALVDLDKLSNRLRDQLCDMRDIVEAHKRSIDLLHGENELLQEIINEHAATALSIQLYVTELEKEAWHINVPLLVNDQLKQVRRLADAIIGPATNEQETKSGPDKA